MNRRLIGIAVALVVTLLAVEAASAQSFLERITQQIQESIPSNEAPPLQTTDEPATNSQRAPLPPPRELSPTPAARGSLGLRVSDVTEDAVRRHQLIVRRGALITAVEKGSAAERAGLPVGGVIVALDGRRVDSPEDLADAVRNTRTGRNVEITFYERDRLVRKPIQLAAGQMPDIPPATDRRITPVPAPANPPPSQPSLGEQLGGNGTRPLLGRIGRVLENVVAPATAIDPAAAPPTVTNRVDPSSEILQLRSQVEQLQRQVDSLQKSLEALEKRLAERK